MKKYLLIGITIIGVLIAACAGMVSQDKTQPEIINPTWQQQAPALFNQIGTSNTGISVLLPPANSPPIPESISQVWQQTNPFGVRDEVLAYILNTIPESKNKARIFAIKMAYYDQLAMFAPESQMNALENKSYAYCICLGHKMTDQDSVRFTQGYGQVLRRNKIAKQLWEQVEHQLSNHVIAADFGNAPGNIEQACNFMSENQE